MRQTWKGITFGRRRGCVDDADDDDEGGGGCCYCFKNGHGYNNTSKLIRQTYLGRN